MKAKSREERISKLKNRTKRSAQERDQKGLGRKSVVDLSKANGTVHKFSIELEKGKIGVIDILPFEISQPWYKDLKMKSGTLTGLDIGDWDYKLEVPVHSNVGENNNRFLCLQQAFGRKCPLCEELYAEWDKPDADQDEKKVDSLKSSWRCFYNVYDYNGQSGAIELGFDVSYKLFEEVLQEAQDSDPDGLATFWDLVDGKSIEFKTREKKLFKNSFHEAHSIRFLGREPYDESILAKVHPLDAMLIIPTYEQVQRVYLGLDDGAPDEAPVSESAAVPLRTRPRQIGEDLPAESSPSTGLRRKPVKKDEKKSTFKCSGSGQFGSDCGSLADCQSCEEEVYNACAEAFAAGQGQKEETDKSTKAVIGDEQPVRRRRAI